MSPHPQPSAPKPADGQHSARMASADVGEMLRNTFQRPDALPDGDSADFLLQLYSVPAPRA